MKKHGNNLIVQNIKYNDEKLINKFVKGKLNESQYFLNNKLLMTKYYIENRRNNVELEIYDSKKEMYFDIDIKNIEVNLSQEIHYDE